MMLGDHGERAVERHRFEFGQAESFLGVTPADHAADGEHREQGFLGTPFGIGITVPFRHLAMIHCQ